MRPKSVVDETLTVPEKTFYRWEEQPRIKTYKARNLLQNRIRNSSGKTYETYYLTLATLDKAWEKHGFDDLSTKKLKELLIAAARQVGWHKAHETPRYKHPVQPEDPNLRTCTSCHQTKPLSQFTRRPSASRAKAYGWKPDTAITLGHKKCNYCASIKRNTLSAQITSPTVAHLRREISEKLQVTRKMYPCAYRDRKYELLIECRTRVEDYLARGVRGPDRWHMMLTKEEKQELESLYNRVAWTRRKPEVF